MAPKPKKELTASEKATLKRLMAGKGALANGKLSMDQQLELQGLKKKAAAAGKATGQAAPRKALKRPTGELSKSNSKLAKFIAGTKSNKLDQAQSRVAAGKYRDMEKAAGKKGFSGFGSLDKSGAALGKAVKQTQKMTKTKKTTSRGPKAGTAAVSKVVNRAKTVAREVRDIPTAAANIYESRSMPKGGVAKFAKKDLKTQIREVGSAIKSGKKGTEAAQQTGIAKMRMKGRVGAGGTDYYISKPKKPRK